MFPGFVSTYRDNNNFVHLFFYPGNDNGKEIYKDIDLSNCQFKYKEFKYLDKSVDYVFYNNNITKLLCKLIDANTGNVIYKELITKIPDNKLSGTK